MNWKNTITSVADSSEDGVAELGNRDASYGMLSEKKKGYYCYMTKWILKRLQ
jgi:hypothetical protein